MSFVLITIVTSLVYSERNAYEFVMKRRTVLQKDGLKYWSTHGTNKNDERYGKKINSNLL